MSYQVLYRAWRPNTFSEICGQDAIVRTLRRQVITGHIAHAYLFCGSRGTGKTTAAKVFARAINCRHPVNGDPDGTCDICKALQAETCMDVVEIDAASNNSVDDVRDMSEHIQYPPSMAKYRVYIIDEAHMLSKAALNALLKTLEEPPRHAVFILVTTEPQALLATTRSRCQRFDFRRISVPVMVERMHTVLKGIGREAEEEALHEIARAAEGALRDALSLLDSCLAFTDGILTLSLTQNVLGTAGRRTMFEFADALIDFDAGRALRIIGEAAEGGSDPSVFLRDATAHIRGLLLAAAAGDVTDLMDITPEDAARLSEQAGRTTQEHLSRLGELFLQSEADMKWISRPRTLLELLAVRACHPEKEEAAGENERLERIEKLLEKGVTVNAPAKPDKEKKTQGAAEKGARPAAGGSSAEPETPADTPPEEYLNAIAALKGSHPPLAPMLEHLRFLHLEGDTVTAEVSRSHSMAFRVLERQKAAVEEALAAAFGRPLKLNLCMPRAAAAQGEPGPSGISRKSIEDVLDAFGRDKIKYTD